MSRLAQSGRSSVSRSTSGAPLRPKADIDADFCEWLEAQVAALRSHQPKFLDWENVAEELDSMGKKERRKLRSHFEILLMHLLKWQFQPQALGRHGRSWKQSILLARARIEDILDDSPSLKRTLDDRIKEAYRRARRYAANETGVAIDKLPEDCPWRVEQLTSDDFFPKI